MQGYANWGGLVKELGFLFVTQFMSLEPSKVTTQNGEEWGTFHRQLVPSPRYSISWSLPYSANCYILHSDGCQKK